MKITLDMAKVSACSASDCAYNVGEQCHAGAITIGDRFSPVCDTYLPSPHHVRHRPSTSGVGTCKVSACRYNREFACGAVSVCVDDAGGAASCRTFRRS